MIKQRTRRQKAATTCSNSIRSTCSTCSTCSILLQSSRTGKRITELNHSLNERLAFEFRKQFDLILICKVHFLCFFFFLFGCAVAKRCLYFAFASYANKQTCLNCWVLFESKRKKVDCLSQTIRIRTNRIRFKANVIKFESAG